MRGRYGVVPRDRLFRSKIGFAAASILASLALVAQTGITTNATWNDSEWVHTPAVSTLDCASPAGKLTSRGEGRVLSGSLLGLDSAELADVASILVTNDGATSTRRPSTAPPVTNPPMPDAFANPLSVGLLDDAITLDLTGPLQLPLNTPAGLIGQFGQAQNTGTSAGASGYLTDQGGINTSGPQSGYPNLATVKLSTLLDSLGLDIGTLTQDIVDVSLEVGAVAGAAKLEDPCLGLWSGDFSEALARNYLAAGLDATVTSPMVANLNSALNGAASNVENQLSALVGGVNLQSSIKTNLLSSVGGLLNSLLASVKLNTNAPTVVQASVSLGSVSLDGLRNLTIEDDQGILRINPASGTVRINTAALLGVARGETGRTTLNQLPPNTNLLSESNVSATLTAALRNAVASWITDVNTGLLSILDSAQVEVKVTVPFIRCSGLPVLGACVGQWLDAGFVTSTLKGTTSQIIGALITPTTDSSKLSLGQDLISLLTNVVGSVTNGLKTALQTVLPGLQTSITQTVKPLAALASNALDQLGNPISGALASVLTGLFESGVVSLTVNAQNHPTTGNTGPPEWASLPIGQFDVAALRLSVLNSGNSSALSLYLGRGSVGPVCNRVNAVQAGCNGS